MLFASWEKGDILLWEIICHGPVHRCLYIQPMLNPTRFGMLTASMMGTQEYALAVCIIVLFIAVIQSQPAPDDYQNPNNHNQNHGNQGNPGNYDCLSSYRTRLRSTFTDGYMNAMCASRNKWHHDRLQNPRGSMVTLDFDRAEQDLYRDLNRPYPSNTHKQTIRLRKEYRMLTDDERHRYHNAINALKRHPVGKSNYYDLLADFHQSHVAPGAHWGPGFLGWHKEYLLRVERALQAIDPSITIPYWDSTLDSHLRGQEANSIMWSDDFMGPKEGTVMSGPFAGWRMSRPVEGRFDLWRGNGSLGRMISDEDVRYIIAINNFRGLTWHVDPYYEMVHGLVHFWIGGPMADIEASPFDPVFFLHHSFIDLMWDTQRERVYREIGRSGYVYTSVYDDQAYGVGEIMDPIADIPYILDKAQNSPHYPPTQMYPFNIRNQDSLNEEYKKIYYYAPRPSCSYSNPSCGSPYLFCILGTYKCAPKLKMGAHCIDFASSDSCYNGECVNGVCRPKSGGDNSYTNFFQYLFTYFNRNYN